VILRKKLSWRRILHYLGLPLALVGLLSVAVCYGVNVLGYEFLALPGLPIAVIGATLGIFLGFRNNTAYDRWWEARVLWGGFVNGSRTFTRQVLTFLDEDPDLARRLVMHQIAFVHATRLHLRRQEMRDELCRVLPDETDELLTYRNVPNAILTRLGSLLHEGFQKHDLGENRLVAIEATLGDLTNFLGGCERIKNTPMLRQYDYVPHLMVNVFCGLLPFALIQPLKWFCAPAAVLIAFLFLALDTIGRNIEGPFENTINDIPMTALCATIETDLRQMIGDPNLPEPVVAIDGFLF